MPARGLCARGRRDRPRVAVDRCARWRTASKASPKSAPLSACTRQPADETHVGEIAAEDTAVERFLQSPDRRGNRSCERGRAYPVSMPEGDAIHRAARRLQVLVGQKLEVETPHPRAAVKQLAPRLDGRRLESVEAIGKNLLFRFEGGLVLRSHLRMKGRWRVLGRDAPIFGTPWLVLKGEEHVGVS